MEATFALDFISLLLSKHTPRQAELSMSPHLKQMVPGGSLNVDVIKTPQKSESAEKDTQTVARGWKLESFNSAANKLLKAASRLEDEVTAETKYWEEILAVKGKGWTVCRLPRERQALGVQYGFLEGKFFIFYSYFLLNSCLFL
jgi:mediator of RNA polymerase II transcription subunit 17